MKTANFQVDAHQHFWRYTETEFGWIDDGMAEIRRDFLPSDLKPLLDGCRVTQTVCVQARQTVAETEWLLGLASENDWIAGVVGWLPLADRDFPAQLDAYAGQRKLCGLRHVLQAEPDEYFERPAFQDGIRGMLKHGLVYDLLVLERQLDTAIRFVDRHPNQIFVLDHAGKPQIGAHELEPWRSRIGALGERQNVCCKLSGMVTEADYQRWSIDDLRPYTETVLDAFGPDRVIFGSDWPVCTVAASYSGWMDAVDTLLAQLSASERSAILGENAVRVYGLTGGIIPR